MNAPLQLNEMTDQFMKLFSFIWRSYRIIHFSARKFYKGTQLFYSLPIAFQSSRICYKISNIVSLTIHWMKILKPKKRESSKKKCRYKNPDGLKSNPMSDAPWERINHTYKSSRTTFNWNDGMWIADNKSFLIENGLQCIDFSGYVQK